METESPAPPPAEEPEAEDFGGPSAPSTQLPEEHPPDPPRTRPPSSGERDAAG